MGRSQSSQRPRQQHMFFLRVAAGCAAQQIINDIGAEACLFVAEFESWWKAGKANAKGKSRKRTTGRGASANEETGTKTKRREAR